MTKIIIISIFLIFSVSELLALECYKCDSNEKECVEIETTEEYEECIEPLCGSWIDENGKTNRGCADTIDKSKVEEICLCDKDKCNIGICPKSRHKCHQCEGSESCKNVENQEPKPCINYKSDDSCYVVVDEDGTTYRGCDSDDQNTPGKQKCSSLDEKCKIGAINDQPATSTDFGCVICDSDKDNENCAIMTQRTPCEPILLGWKAKCYTIETEGQIIRDCYYGAKESQCIDAGLDCRTCPTDGCNNEVFLSLKCQKCETCTSETEKNSGFCFVKPDNEKHLACYHRLEDDKVSRGCLDSLEEPIKTICLENENQCKTCKDPECNNKSSFRKCYKCNSRDDANCATLRDPSKLIEITCPNYEENECATWITENDGTTYRDCKGAVSSITALVCTCQTDFCNNEDCPKSRLKCHQCQGPDCVTVDTPKYACQNYDLNQKCYTVIDDSPDPAEGFRGCSSDTGIGMSKCTELKDFCITGDDNAQPGFSDEFKCVQCSTNSISSNDSCVYNTEATSCGSIPLGRPIECFTMMDGDRLIRDCYYEEKKKDCDDNKDLCKKCDESGCNIEPYRALSCRKCNGNVNCRDEKGKEDEFGFCLAEKYSDEELACYRKQTEDGTIVSRGCFNMIKDLNERKECKENSDLCKICNFKRCNDKVDFQICYNCSSNELEDCATLANDAFLPSITCKGYHDKCAVLLSGLAAQDTTRSCISNPTLECPDTHCEICTDNLCNKNVYPKTRKKCHRCTEDKHPNCVNNLETSNEFLHYCPKYDSVYGDICFGVVGPDNTMIRGCRTDFELYEKCIEKDEKCLSCESEKCNFGEKIRQPSLSCIYCEPSNLLGNCLWGVNAEKSKKCNETVLFGDKENCFTIEYASDVVRRACLNDFPDILDDQNIMNATICSTSACNNENVIKQGCLVCDSEIETCKYENPDIEVTECYAEVQEFEERWCYTMINPVNNEVTRGCFVDMTENLKKVCLNATEKTCDRCHEYGCNNRRPPNVGSLIATSVIILCFVIFIHFLINIF